VRHSCRSPVPLAPATVFRPVTAADPTSCHVWRDRIVLLTLATLRRGGEAQQNHMMPVFNRDPGQTALQAFRLDMPTGGRAPTAADNAAIAVATLLRFAAMPGNRPQAPQMLSEATRVAKQSLGARWASRVDLVDGPDEASPLDGFRVLGERCCARGQDHLHDHMLESIESLSEPGSLTQGRVMFRRAVKLFELGNEAAATLRLAELLAEPHWKQYDELKLRGWQHWCVRAHARGNAPEADRFARRIVRAAGSRYPFHKGVAYTTIGILAAQRKDLNRGLEYLWKAYELLAGSVGVHYETLMGNITQILLDAGYPAAARAGFARMLSQTAELRVIYMALGGYASASAALGDKSAVEWAGTEVLRLAKNPNHPNVQAYVMFECSEALEQIGEHARAGTFRRRALRMAERYGYHTLTFKAQARLTVSGGALPLTRTAEAVRTFVTEMAPDHLPTQLAYAE
jgi:hypothetical protein